MNAAFRIFVFLCALVLSAAPVAEAHTLESDGDIQGVMHIQPSHEPTAGEPAHFEFFMKNTKESFDANAYAYTLILSGEGMTTATPVVSVRGSTLVADYTFTHEGDDDTVTLVGSSTVADQPSFSLDFDDIKVLPAGQHEDPLENLFEQHGGHVLIVGLIILAFMAIVAWDRLVVRRRQPEVSPNENS